VLTIAHRYRDGALGHGYRTVAAACEIGALNQDALEAVMAPVPELLAELRTVAAELDGACDAFTDDTVIPVHTFASVSGIAWQTYWWASYSFMVKTSLRLPECAGRLANATCCSSCAA
jgi:hypothetical protein